MTSVKLLTQRNSTTYLKSIALFALAASPDERKVVYCKIYCLPGPYILLRDNFRTQHSVSKMDAPTDPEDCLVHPLIKTYIIQFHYTCIQFHTVEVINSTLKSRVPGSLPPWGNLMLRFCFCVLVYLFFNYYLFFNLQILWKDLNKTKV